MANSQGSCPECGAALDDGLRCWGLFEWVLAWEVDDSELAAEHFFTVACYNLQHPAQFTNEALAWLRSALIDALDNGVPASELRRRAARGFNGPQRVLRPKLEREPALHRWAMTIGDVYLHSNPDGAAGRVREWAAAIRQEL